jgi:hypothetical protein
MSAAELRVWLLRLHGSSDTDTYPSHSVELWELSRILGGLSSVVSGASRDDTVFDAFLSGVRHELDSYYADLAALDAELGAELALEALTPPSLTFPRGTGGALQHVARGASLDGAPIEAQIQHDAGAAGAQSWVLRRLESWAVAHLDSMRALLSVVRAVDSQRGASICSTIFAHKALGDGRTCACIARVFACASAPLHVAVREWMIHGILPARNSFVQLFIEEAAPEEVERDGPWIAGPRLILERLPTYIPLPLANGIVRVGKAVKFLREANSDGQWVCDTLEPLEAPILRKEAHAAAPDDESDLALSLAGLPALANLVHTVTALVNFRLMQQLLGRHRALAHLQIMHRYVLLTQGDFVSLLLGGMKHELDRPASALVMEQHVLSGHLEVAVRGSNAGLEDRALVDRLFVQFGSPTTGATGWDVFNLGYAVEAPLNVLVPRRAQDAYSRLFSFLWRLRRCEDALSLLWNASKVASAGIEWLAHAGLARLLHTAALARMHMGHFLSCLSGYLMLDVLAPAWARLEEGICASANLDDILVAHQEYLDELNERVLFADVLKNDTESNVFSEGASMNAAADARAALSDTLDIILRFTVEVSKTLSAAEPLANEARGMGIRAQKMNGPLSSAEADASAEAVREALSRQLNDIVNRRSGAIKELAGVFRIRLDALLTTFETFEARCECADSTAMTLSRPLTPIPHLSPRPTATKSLEHSPP